MNAKTHRGCHQLDDIQIAKCLTLDRNGKNQREIADVLGCHQSTVHHVLKLYNYETFTGRDTTHGRPRKTTEADDRHLIVTAKRNYDRPLHDITNLSGLSISIKTATRRLKEVELVSRYKQRKPYLTKEHKKARLEWANAHSNWTIEDWKKVIFSNECLLRVGVDSRRQRVIGPPGAILEERYLQPTFKSNRVTIMIWGCFSGEDLGPVLTFEQGGISSDEYQEVLYDGLLSLIDDLLGPPESDTIIVADTNTFLFMHDNVPCHQTREVQDLLKENDIPVMDWPAQSPDLNPIEHVWRDLKHRFYLKFLEFRQCPSRSQASFERYNKWIQECWEELDREFLIRLLESMPARCQVVIDANGGHMKY